LGGIVKNKLRIWISATLLALAGLTVGCDEEGAICESGKGAKDVEHRWGACNGSCDGKDNKASCAKAKTLAAEVCKFTKGSNGSACRTACEAGDKESCEVQKK